MDKEKVTGIKGWEDTGKWLVELIEQTRTNAKRWFVAWIITLIALVGTNMAWLYVFQSYDYVSQFSDGINSINSGTQGDIINEPKGEDKEERQKQGI